MCERERANVKSGETIEKEEIMRERERERERERGSKVFKAEIFFFFFFFEKLELRGLRQI